MTESKSNQVKNLNPRIRSDVKCCYNCRHSMPGVKDSYCILDGCTISPFQVCKDWENDA